MANERDYVLGTNDEEVVRLGIQHQVWRPRALDAWRRAGFTVGRTLLDVGSGPGYATFDLADIVGPTGRVVSFDRSRRFLDALEARIEREGRSNIEVHELDFDASSLPEVGADGCWCRWVLAFVQRPEKLIDEITASVRKGGVFVSHEYLHYCTWRLSPRSAEHEEFVQVVVRGWRDAGGEPDIGMDIPRWLEGKGWRLIETRTIVDVVKPDNFVWQWPKTFIASSIGRQIELGTMSREQGERVLADFETCERTPGAFMVTPVVLETIAERL